MPEASAAAPTGYASRNGGTARGAGGRPRPRHHRNGAVLATGAESGAVPSPGRGRRAAPP